MGDIPYGYCHCGCGQETRIAKCNNTRDGYVKGEPVRYLPGHNVMVPPRPAPERFWEKVNKAGDDECWEWTGATGHGYGQFCVTRRTCTTAHRYMWEMTHGKPKRGQYVRQTCGNRRCVNPAHLELTRNHGWRSFRHRVRT